jgi:hypothetical protein
VVIAGLMLIVGAPRAFADAGDDTLRFYLAKADVVVAGTIAAEPVGRMGEQGVITYLLDVKASEVVAGDAGKARRMHVYLNLFEFEPGDRLAYLRKGAKVILFQKRAEEGAVPLWEGADVWFGIQPYHSTMAMSLKRLAAEPTTRPSAATAPAGGTDLNSR